MPQKNNGIRVLLVTVCTVLGLILAAGIGLTIYANYMFGQVGRLEGTDETLSQEQIDQIIAEDTVAPDATTAPVMDEEDVDWGENEGQVIESADNIVNIMLVGQDSEGNQRSRSDTMILVTFNKENKTITMTSFLRDLYVKIPGNGSTKMNAAYVFGGMDLLGQTLEQNFGVQVDGFVEVNFSRFPDVIDLLGGVDMELRADEASMINFALNRYELNKGMMHLDGEQALYYSRIRNLDADADFSRTNRQRKVITALIEKFRNTKLTTLLGLLDDLLPMIATDMSNGELIELATDLFPMLSGCQIVSQRIPANEAYHLATIDGLSCVVADMDAARELLKQTMGE